MYVLLLLPLNTCYINNPLNFQQNFKSVQYFFCYIHILHIFDMSLIMSLNIKKQFS